MSYLLKYIYLLKHLAFRILVLHVALIYCLDRHILASQFVYPQGHFPEGALAYQLDKFVVVEGSRGYLIVLFDVGFNELDDFVTLAQDVLVQGHFARGDWQVC